MTLESMISGLSHDEKLAALDLLWQELSREPSKFESPDWHREAIAARLANPAVGERLSLNEAEVKLRAQLNARRTDG